MKLENKYVIGCHVMFYEIAMYSEYIDGLINLLEDIDNKENVVVDLCFNISEKIEKIDRDKISKDELISIFNDGIKRLEKLKIANIKTRIITPEDGYYFHADYRRDLNYNYCKEVDFVMHGETDSFFPKEALQSLETLSVYTQTNNIHRYAVCFADRKMWDNSWDATVHPNYLNHVYDSGPNHHLNPNQAKSRMSIEDMNKINSEVTDFDFTYINYPKIDGSCLVLSSDLIKFGVNVPPCLIYHDDHGVDIMARKLCGDKYIQFICKNLLKVHARRHPQKRLYVLNEDNSYSLGEKVDTFEKFKELSNKNIKILSESLPNRFYTYNDFKKLTNE